MKKIYGIIYKATNKINGKIYIGQTISPLKLRISRHVSDALVGKSTSYFHKAIKKYSKDNFEWLVLVRCFSPEELNLTEIEMINRYNSMIVGYNLSNGGQGSMGCRPSLKTKYKQSFAKIGSKNPAAKKYLIITPDGEEIIVHGIKEFCRNYVKEKLHYKLLIRVAQGKYKQYKGYKCKYYKTS